MAYIFFEETLATEAANALGAISLYNFELKQHNLVCSFCKTTLARISKSSEMWKVSWELNPCLPRSKFVIQVNPTWKIYNPIDKSLTDKSFTDKSLLQMQMQSPIQEEPQTVIDVRDFLLSQEARTRKAGKSNCCAKREEFRVSSSSEDQLQNQLFIVEEILAERISPEGKFYKVRWAGFSAEHDSWEPDEAISNCKEVLKAWNTSRKATNFLYTVQEILGKRVSPQGTLYRVRWAGFSSDEDSWEPAEALLNCEEALQSWNVAPKAIRSGPAML